MEALAPLLLLACPVGMGAMMWMMMRGSKTSTAEDSSHKQAELAALQAQIDQLQAQGRDEHRVPPRASDRA